ncbi:type I restriction enzyme, S subunit [Bacillus sp. 166amftsu]|nr:type I restriction enzyme, S subunit [Bacillus sp. 166amftsu]
MGYPQYKKTSLEWLEDIPSEWEYGGLTKYLDSIVDYRGKTPEKVEEGIFLVTAKNIKHGKINYWLSQEFVKLEEYEEVMRRGLPEIGDVLFTTEAPLGEVANVDRIDIALAQRIIKFRGIENVLDNYYLKYWIQSHGFQSHLRTFATGSTAAGIKASKLSSLQILLPSYSEQKQIVIFLDNKVQEIDNLIAQKEQMISLFEEKRQSMITEAVTKGLNPNVKMKNSGVEWIGEIPEHWDIKKMKYLTQSKLMYGANESAELDDRTLPRYIRITDIDQHGKLKDDTFKSLSKEVADQYPVIKGDILFARSGATVGKSYYHGSKEIASFAGYLIRLRVRKEYNSKYLYYYTQSSIYKEWIQSILIQATIQNVSAEKYANLEIPIPALSEMNQTVEHIEEIDTNIYSFISLVTEQIQKLKEYRQSLIYEVVTGKIDVRDFEVES